MAMKNDSVNVSQELNKKANRERLKDIYRRYGIFLIFVCMFIVSSLISPNFIRIENLVNIVRQNAAITILACGMTVIIISGSIDLSAGSVLALAGCLASGVMVKTNSVLAALLVGIVSASILEWCNSLIITSFDLPPFIATMAMQNIAKGLVQVYTNGTAIVGIGNMAKLGSGYIGFVPVPIIIMLVCIAITFLFLRYTPLGLYVYSIGGNEKATALSGVKTRNVFWFAYASIGLMAGLAGILTAARARGIDPTYGEGYEMDAIASCFIGGASAYGGIGKVSGMIIGAVLMGVINQGMGILGVDSNYQKVVKGIVLLVAVMFDVLSKRQKR